MHLKGLADSGLGARKMRSAFGCSQTRDITVAMACTLWDWSIDRWVQAAYHGHLEGWTWHDRVGPVRS